MVHAAGQRVQHSRHENIALHYSLTLDEVRHYAALNSICFGAEAMHGAFLRAQREGIGKSARSARVLSG